MSLSERIAERRKCAVVACPEPRGTDSLFCGAHLNDMWGNRLQRQDDGSFVPARRWAPKDLTGRLA